jgi:hypothetical protein
VTKPEVGADLAIGLSVVLVTLGAALVWGTTAHVRGGLTLLGVVLLVVGAAGVVASLVYRRRRAHPGRETRDDTVIVDC